MSNLAIRTMNISKQFRISHRNKSLALHEALEKFVHVPFRSFYAKTRRAYSAHDYRYTFREKYFQALDDISFEVEYGEALGIIGGNGAGKSVLLKVLSRITRPTTGHAELFGRVGALLGVGTGFHPELTGRENIYLSGATLGMKKAEINSKFDEIVAFAEVEEFLDTPVKRYSEGMEVRLGFSVAAHMEPEIMLIDEVLAIADGSFQQKCIKKIIMLVSEGRTLLIVSHNLDMIKNLCPRTILLHAGKIETDGPTPEVISRYLAKSRMQTRDR